MGLYNITYIYQIRALQRPTKDIDPYQSLVLINVLLFSFFGCCYKIEDLHIKTSKEKEK